MKTATRPRDGCRNRGADRDARRAASKRGFWARLFGRGGDKENKE
jgi:hypothetical protein